MSKKYKNPPVKEAVCEFRFNLAEKVENINPEQVFNDISSLFPTKKKGQIMQVELKLGPKADKPDYNQTLSEFDEFLSEDKKLSVQLDGSRLSIHKLEPYDSWENFSEIIRKVFNAYIKNISVESLQRVGLRYVNVITLPPKPIELAEYFNAKPQLPEAFAKNKIVSFLIGSVIEFEDGKDNAKIQLVERADNEKGSGFILDLDYFTSQLTPPAVDKALNWLENAHKNIEEIFEEILTKKSKLLFDS